MSSTDLAIDYARKLVNAEARGPGDIEPAMYRLETKTGIGYWTLWGLWNRRRKGVDRDLFNLVRGAYLAMCEQQIARFKHELKLEKARGGNDSVEDLTREAEALVARLAETTAKLAARRNGGGGA